MPSLPGPAGAIPPKAAPTLERNDVNLTEASSVSDPVEVAAKGTATLEESDAIDVDDSDLVSIEESKKIPYSRFKEKVDETKSLKEQVTRLREDQNLAIQRAIEDAELRMKARMDRQKEDSSLEDLDPYERKIHSTNSEIKSLKDELRSLREQAEQSQLQANVTRLKTQFPEADELAVLGWKRSRPNADLEDLMMESHNRNLERDKRRLQEILEHKKAKAKKSVSTREGGFRLKENEIPKSIKEAKAMTKRLWGG